MTHTALPSHWHRKRVVELSNTNAGPPLPIRIDSLGAIDSFEAVMAGAGAVVVGFAAVLVDRTLPGLSHAYSITNSWDNFTANMECFHVSTC